MESITQTLTSLAHLSYPGGEWFLPLLCMASLLLFALNTAAEVGFTYFSHDEGKELLAPTDNHRDRIIVSLAGFANETIYTTSVFRIVCVVIFAVSSLPLITTYFPTSTESPTLLAALLAAACFLLFLFGHIVPRKLVLSSPLGFCRSVCIPFHFTLRAVRPLVPRHKYAETHSPGRQDIITVDEVEKLLDRKDETKQSEKSIIREIIKFTEEEVGEVMTSRVDIVALDVKSDYAAVMQCIRDNNYSRIPIYEDNLDNVKGILYIKDLLSHLSEPPAFAWQTLMRPPYFVPETKMTDELLREFQKNKIHIALVVDEFGSISGLVTMEDLLEEIVGEINDEYDDDRLPYIRLSDNSYIFEAKILLTDFLRAFDEDEDYFLTVSENAESLGGILLELFGEVPHTHATAEFGKYKFEVLSADERRIIKVKVMVA